jgi:hypothetical protein
MRGDQSHIMVTGIVAFSMLSPPLPSSAASLKTLVRFTPGLFHPANLTRYKGSRIDESSIADAAAILAAAIISPLNASVLLIMLVMTGAYVLSLMAYERPIAMMPLPLLPLVVVHHLQLPLLIASSLHTTVLMPSSNDKEAPLNLDSALFLCPRWAFLWKTTHVSRKKHWKENKALFLFVYPG